MWPWGSHLTSLGLSVLICETGGFPGGSDGKEPAAVCETSGWSLGQKVRWRREWLYHSSILAWRIPWTEEPSGLQSMPSHRVGRDWTTAHTGPRTQCSCDRYRTSCTVRAELIPGECNMCSINGKSAAILYSNNIVLSVDGQMMGLRKKRMWFPPYKWYVFSTIAPAVFIRMSLFKNFWALSPIYMIYYNEYRFINYVCMLLY